MLCNFVMDGCKCKMEIGFEDCLVFGGGIGGKFLVFFEVEL